MLLRVACCRRKSAHISHSSTTLCIPSLSHRTGGKSRCSFLRAAEKERSAKRQAACAALKSGEPACLQQAPRRGWFAEWLLPDMLAMALADSKVPALVATGTFGHLFRCDSLTALCFVSSMAWAGIPLPVADAPLPAESALTSIACLRSLTFAVHMAGMRADCGDTRTSRRRLKMRSAPHVCRPVH